jgi:transposase-like protein
LTSSGRTIKHRRRFSVEEKQAILQAAAGSTVSEASYQYGVGRSLQRLAVELGVDLAIGQELAPAAGS